MRRRGFTLLETMLAAAIGALVVAAALAAMTVALRADSTLVRRAESQTQLARVHRVMQRTFSTLRMAEGSLGTPPMGPDGRTPVTPEEHERILLARDPPPDVRLRLEPDPRDPTALTQHLVVVLSAAPIVSDMPRSREMALDEFDPETLDQRSADPAPASTPADIDANADADAAVQSAEAPRDGVRGAFALYASSEPTDPDANPAETGSALWWVPESGDAVEVARGIAALRWRVFKRDAMLDSITAWAAEQLPAYVELEVATVHGGYASYLFEVSWTTSPDVAAPADLPLDAAADPAAGLGEPDEGVAPRPRRVRPDIRGTPGPGSISEGGR